MKKTSVIPILLIAAIAASGFSGCKKEASEEPVVIYYSEGQAEESAVVVTFADEGNAEQNDEPEVLAPILADRTQTTETAAVETNASETEVTESAAATTAAQPAQTEAAETTAEDTQATTQTTAQTTAQTAAQTTSSTDASVPVITSGTHVYDNAGVIADESSLNSAMDSFQSDTGISPAIFTINNSLSGDDFRQYARETYSSNFSDQDHVLIVYQLTPQGTWSWTCVFGSNTGTVFTQDHINQFQSDLTNAFSSGNVDNALVTTFNNAESYN